MTKRISDKDIRYIVNSLDVEIPAEIDNRVNSLIGSTHGFPVGSVWYLNFIFKWSPLFVTIIFLMILGISRSIHRAPEAAPLKEIRIEYEVKEKNIKIIWIKKEDFLLGRKEK